MKKIFIGLVLLSSMPTYAEKVFSSPTLSFDLEEYDVADTDWNTKTFISRLKKESKSLKVNVQLNCHSDLDIVCTQLQGKESRANQNTLECEDTKGPFWKSIGLNLKAIKDAAFDVAITPYYAIKDFVECPRYQSCIQIQANPEYFLIPTITVINNEDISFKAAIHTPVLERLLEGGKGSKPISVVSSIECE